MDPIVIVGSGLAGYSLLREIRKLSDLPATLITADDGSYYSKPALSTALSAGKDPSALASSSAEAKAADLKASILPHALALSIDPKRRVLLTSAGPIPYSALVLALGAAPVLPALEGDASGLALPVNDLASYAAFRSAIEGKKRVAILGGGLIGCEFANDLSSSGFEATVVHSGLWPLDRLLPRDAGEALARALAPGVSWSFGNKARSLRRRGEALALALADGSEIFADAVLSAIGLRPRTDLALRAGIATARGILTNAFLETSEPFVYALGDCAEVDGLHLPYVQPLSIQAKALASTLCGSRSAVSYPLMPVAVKTPSFPIAALAPPAGSLGAWSIEPADSGVKALFLDPDGKTIGFALGGSEARRRQEILRSMQTP